MISFNENAIPTAGGSFDYYIYRESVQERYHTVVAAISNVQFYQKTTDCPDPPCHETFYLPMDSGGNILSLSYSNNTGKTETFSFPVEFPKN